MVFGKKMALAREKGEDDELDHVMMFMPKYPHREHEMTVSVKVDGRAVKLLGIFDGVDFRRHIVADDKTGAKRWTQAMADRSEQLTWYAMIYFMQIGVVPQLRIHWIETIKPLPYVAPDIIRATGKSETLETSRTPKDFVVLMGRISECWRGIVALTQQEWESVI